MADSRQPILSVKGLRKEFGGITALADMECDVREGEIKAVIGPNGAGKTTFFNVVTGVTPPTSGSIHFRGKSLCRFPCHRIAALGIARTFQAMRLFHNMNVLENVMVGSHTKGTTGLLKALVRHPGMLSDEKLMREAGMSILRFVGLERKARRRVAELSFYEQRRLEISRALAADPRLLLLDEPAAGLNISETEDMGDLVRRIRDRGITVVLVEHDMSLVMEISDEVVVLDHGEKIAQGTPEQIQVNERVIAVYLGEEIHA